MSYKPIPITQSTGTFEGETSDAAPQQSFIQEVLGMDGLVKTAYNIAFFTAFSFALFSAEYVFGEAEPYVEVVAEVVS
eukprot:CAMPEP_0184361748 /NCGR_PEP_ID=MMETSP1089-20130417/131830_1 /TAXON_ID=38269 ORGANISM="Gloeochaete wittrockiana, Strain SAG46.84" /NCGR_SAMPLE_ID=MMETSP1089 /ASSEMBLY_ACC=CAM_ASM_000445 /LENGTH=77 /DNA_ID=CAMNT_0026701551 /DNA_START=73 /DNA_END=302 /DNA_ORIENTATION=-